MWEVALMEDRFTLTRQGVVETFAYTEVTQVRFNYDDNTGGVYIGRGGWQIGKQDAWQLNWKCYYKKY